MNMYIKIMLLLLVASISGCSNYFTKGNTVDLNTKSGKMIREGHRQTALGYFKYAFNEKGAVVDINLDKMEESLLKGQLSYADIKTHEAVVKNLRISSHRYLARQYLYSARKNKGDVSRSLRMMEYYLGLDSLPYAEINSSAEEILRLSLKK